MNASGLPPSGRQLFDELQTRPNLCLQVGEHVVDIGALRLLTRPDSARLSGKALAVLIELARTPGATVTRGYLLERVWADRVTTPDVLTQAIVELRRAFLDDAKPPRYIETVPRVGYRLLAPVALLDAGELGASSGLIEVKTAELVELGPAINPPLVVREKRKSIFIGALLAIVAMVLAMAIGSWVSRVSLPTATTTDWAANDKTIVTSDPGAERRPAVSPDGTRVAYAQRDESGTDRIFIREIGRSQSVLLTAKATSFEELPMWSPDGLQIAFERIDGRRCTVYTAAVVGGDEREVGPCRAYLMNYFDWTPDGKGLITADNVNEVSASKTLVLWNLATGAKEPLRYARTPEHQDLDAHYSPDGKWIAFRRGLAPYSDLCVMSAEGGSVRQLTTLASRIRGFTWIPDSRGLIFASNHEGHFTLYTVDLENRRVQSLNIGSAEHPMASRMAHTIVYEIPNSRTQLAEVSIAGDKSVLKQLSKSTGSDSSPAMSPKGERVAFISNRSGDQQVWLYDFATASANMLSQFKDAVLINPNWSEDGERLLITVRQTDESQLVEFDLETRRERVVYQPTEKILSGSYASGVENYLIVEEDAQKHSRIVTLKLSNGVAETRTVLAESVEHVEIDQAQQRVYYTKNAQKGLFSRALADRSEKLVTSMVESSSMDGWRVVDGRIWFLSRVAWHPTELVEFDPATGKDRVLTQIDAELRDVAFSVAPARDRIIIAPLDVQDIDVGAFQLSQTPGSLTKASNFFNVSQSFSQPSTSSGAR